MNCPYCSDPDIFQKAYAAPVESRDAVYMPNVRNIWRVKGDAAKPVALKEPEVRNGPYSIITVTGEDLIGQLSDFMIEVLGVKYSEEPPWPPPDQFFRQTEEVYHSGRERRRYWYLYNIYRVTHAKTDLVIDVHWWPVHGRVVTIQDFPPQGPTTTDLEVINEAIKLFRVETRGGVKITEERLRRALAEAGPSPSQREVALYLNVTESGLEKWRTRRGIGTWHEVVERFTG